ncbi:TPA: hypothetical protein HA244_04405 [Candidatus Micrarchaeota archaeon]|nr:hypothetical protein [Candidatus Micrarchaeota archaeon]
MAEGQDAQVGVFGTVAEAKRPLLVMGTRYDYMMTQLPEYKKMIRFRLYALLAFLAGAWLLLIQPILSAAAFFLAAYYYQLYLLQQHRTTHSIRTVMIGH